MRAPVSLDGGDGEDVRGVGGVGFDAVDLGAEVELAAEGDDFFGDVLPELAGAELGIEEALDERGVGGLLGDVAGWLIWACA